MVEEFSQIVTVVEKLNEPYRILRAKDILEQKENIVDFANERKILLFHMAKLQAVERQYVQTITRDKVSGVVGPVTLILLDIDRELMDYKWQFFTMAAFLKPLVNYYRQKARRNNCTKEHTTSNPLLIHTTKNPYFSRIHEFEDLVTLLELHNNYLGTNKILTLQEIKLGYQNAQELSSMGRDIQEIVNQLEMLNITDICIIDSLLRLLYGKITISCDLIFSIIEGIIRKMIGFYPDCELEPY